MKSRYGGYCRFCNEPYPVGATIDHIPEMGGYVHAACALDWAFAQRQLQRIAEKSRK